MSHKCLYILFPCDPVDRQQILDKSLAAVDNLDIYNINVHAIGYSVELVDEEHNHDGGYGYQCDACGHIAVPVI